MLSGLMYAISKKKTEELFACSLVIVENDREESTRHVVEDFCRDAVLSWTME